MKKLLEQALRDQEALQLVGQGKDSAVYKITAEDGQEYVMKFSPEPTDNQAVMRAMRALGRPNSTQALEHMSNEQLRQCEENIDAGIALLLQQQENLKPDAEAVETLMQEKERLTARGEWKGAKKKQAMQAYKSSVTTQKTKIAEQISHFQQGKLDIQKQIDSNTRMNPQLSKLKASIAQQAGVDAQHVAVEPWMGDVILDGDAKWAAISPNDAVDTIDKALNDLTKLHNAGIVHGDIAPTNISRNGLIDITGFKDGQQVTQDTRGTEGYTDVESTLATRDGQAHLSKASDVYAMGMLMHDMMDAYKLHDQLPGASSLVRQMTDLDPRKRPDIRDCKDAWETIKAHCQIPKDSPAPEARFTDPRFVSKTKARHAIVASYASLKGNKQQPSGSLTQNNQLQQHHTKIDTTDPSKKTSYTNIYLRRFPSAFKAMQRVRPSPRQLGASSKQRRPAVLRQKSAQPSPPQLAGTKPGSQQQSDDDDTPTVMI